MGTVAQPVFIVQSLQLRLLLVLLVTTQIKLAMAMQTSASLAPQIISE
jgi:hypothetical protein